MILASISIIQILDLGLFVVWNYLVDNVKFRHIFNRSKSQLANLPPPLVKKKLVTCIFFFIFFFNYYHYYLFRYLTYNFKS